jgi:antitoxin ParD1/3/4
MHDIPATVDPHFREFIARMVEAGRYPDAGAALNAALALLEDAELLRQAKLERLRADIQEGIDSGPGEPAKIVMARIKSKVLAKHGHKSDPRG